MKTISRSDLEQGNIRNLKISNDINWNHDMGIWVDGQFSWSAEKDYSQLLQKSQLQTEIKKQSIINNSTFLFEYVIHNEMPAHRKIKLFFFNRGVNTFSNDQNHTAFFSPVKDHMLHYVEDKCILTSGFHQKSGICQYTTGVMNDQQIERFSHDDGMLLFQPLARGDVYSIFSLEGWLEPYDCASFYYWVTVNKDKESVVSTNEYIQTNLEVPQMY